MCLIKTRMSRNTLGFHYSFGGKTVTCGCPVFPTTPSSSCEDRKNAGKCSIPLTLKQSSILMIRDIFSFPFVVLINTNCPSMRKLLKHIYKKIPVNVRF